MEILDKSDSEIKEIAEAIWIDIKKGSNERNWELFTKYTPKEMATEEFKENVEKQWETNKVLTTLTEKHEFVDILRREDFVLVVWKQWSTEVPGDFLGLLYLQSIEGEVKVIGTWLK